MGNPRAVWIDYCCAPQRHGLVRHAARWCDVLHLDSFDAAASAASGHRPRFVCVEFDFPDQQRLQAVPLLRRRFPTAPLLMLTDFHSEALAVWALRSRVWDYRVKPVDEATLEALIRAMLEAGEFAVPRLSAPLPPNLVPPAGHLRRPLVAAPRTGAAVAYVTEHFGEPCRLATLAKLCSLSESEFSRVFHREHGVTFRQFLLEYRITRARSFLAEPGASVSQVAYEVGFNDLTQFGRMFKRVVGTPPARYQQRIRASCFADAVHSSVVCAKQPDPRAVRS